MLHIFASVFSCMLQEFFKKYFRNMLQQVFLCGCCISFTHMLQVFYLNIAYVSHICYNCIFKCFICVRYMLHSCCKCFTGQGGRWTHGPGVGDEGAVEMGVDEGAAS
jgi:hypothetical protein